MNTGRARVIWGLVLAVGVGWVLASLFRGRSREGSSASHDGRPLELWLYGYFRSRTAGEFEANYRALEALRKESIPALAELCLENLHPQRWERVVAEVRRHLGAPEAGPSREDVYRLSEFALRTWDPRGSEVEPIARQHFEGGWLPAHRKDALALLRFVAVDPEPCVPLLVRGYEHGAVEVGEVASEVGRELFKDAPPPRGLLEPLVGLLRRGASGFQELDDSYAFLGNFGRAASNAVPVVRERFEREPTNYVKLRLATVWARIDPGASRALDFLVDTALDEGTNGLRSGAFVALLELGAAAAPAAGRIWERAKREPSNHTFDDLLTRMGEVRYSASAPGEAASGGGLGALPLGIRQGFVERLERCLTDPGRTNALEHRLNPAWHLLRLDPGHAEAWRVFRSLLFQEVDNDRTNGNVLRASTAMEYLRSIPISVEAKKELLREVERYYADPNSGKQRLLRRTATKHRVELDPAERPKSATELMALYLD